jgi:hypothetical protein
LGTKFDTIEDFKITGDSIGYEKRKESVIVFAANSNHRKIFYYSWNADLVRFAAKPAF